MPSQSARRSLPLIPFEITSTLHDSLSDRGIEQWWSASNRALDGRVPSAVWDKDPDAVISAAESFDQGYYL